MSPLDDATAMRAAAAGRTGVEARDSNRAVFGQVMGLVGITLCFLAAGAYIGRDITGIASLLLLLGAFACVFALNVAAQRSEQLAIVLLFGVGLLLGMAVGPILAYYANSDPGVLWQAGGATAGFVGVLGSYGYATRRDLSHWARALFWALLGLLALGVVLIFVNIPGGNLIWAILGLVIFGGFTIFDFNRLRRASMQSAVPIAAGIFLDIFNIFLFFLTIFGGGRD